MLAHTYIIVHENGGEITEGTGEKREAKITWEIALKNQGTANSRARIETDFSERFPTVNFEKL